MDDLPKKCPFLRARKGITIPARKLFDRICSGRLFSKQRIFILGYILVGITILSPLISEKLIPGSQRFMPEEIMFLDYKAMTDLLMSAEPGALQAGSEANDSPRPKPVLAAIIETNEKEKEPLIIIQENTLFSANQHFLLPEPEEPKIAEKWQAILTAYTSRPEETDDTPFITASGTRTRKGIVANNFLPFGTRIKIPEIYGDKIFVVEDRMHWRKSNNHVDIWFSCLAKARKFGIKEGYIKILKD